MSRTVFFAVAASVLLVNFILAANFRQHHSLLPSLKPPMGSWTPCGLSHPRSTKYSCMCLDNAADCTDRGLDIIPVFNRSITMLLFSYNELELFVTHPYLFHVTHLDLSFNNIGFFRGYTFHVFPKLKVLDFSGNAVGLRDLVVRFVVPAVEELDISLSPDRGGSIPFKEIDKNLDKLRVLIMNAYDFKIIDLTALRNTQVQELQVRGTQFSSTEFVPHLLPNLEKMDLANNNLRFIFYTCYDDSASHTAVLKPFFPKLSYISLTGNIIGRANSEQQPFSSEKCLPELSTLLLDSNIFGVIHTNEFSGGQTGYPKLQYLSLKAAGVSFVVETRAFDNPSIRRLDLSLNGLHFPSDQISESAFDGCRNLSDLNLQGNHFRGVSEFKFQRLFSDLIALKVLNLGNTKMDRISRVLWTTLRNLSTILLHDNLITTIPEGTFDDLIHLVVLRLDGNHIATVSEGTFSPDLRGRLTSLNLSLNHFECTCALLWFRDWLVASPALFHDNDLYSHYECRNLPGTELSSFMQNRQPCLFGHDAYIFTVVCSAVLVTALLLASQLYRYRWHIRLVLYEAFRGKPEARRQQRGPGDYRYDLFVSYDSEDQPWITRHLMPVLEEEMGLRLCVHFRDFIPGKNIVDNIVDSLHVSRRVLTVFSPTFADSHWCHFELEMCLSQVVDNNDVMVVVMLKHVPSRDMSGAMLALINTTTYIEWGEHLDSRTLFWRRLTLALTDILPATSQ